ncbi:MAG: hypothetical protein ACTHLH_11280 [Solirubrobacterales bacterium]
MKKIRKRLTYANVMSSIAVFLVIGGASAFAASHLAKNSVGTKQLKNGAVTTGKLKKNAVTTAKIKNNAVNGSKVQDQSLTGADINLSTLGTVPSAANAANATNATNAAHLAGFTPFSGHGSNNSMTPLFSTGQFEVVGICSEEDEFDPPGFQFENVSSAIGIINRGQNGGVADTYDDDNIEFNIGEGVAFDYLDAGDPGTAVLPNGHWIHVLGGTITEFSTNPNFGAGCTFHGLAFFG